MALNFKSILPKKLRYFLIDRYVKYKHKKYDGKVAFLTYPPKYVTIGITGYCGFNCKFCCSHSKDAKYAPSNHQYKIAYNLTYEEFLKLVDMIIKAGVPHIHIAGVGEPLFNPDFFEMIDYLLKFYPYTSLQTDFMKKLVEKQDAINNILKRKKKIKYITTDLYPEAYHNEIKIGSNFDYVVNCLEEISKHSNIIIDIHHILTRQTYKYIDTLVYDLHKRKIKFKLNIVHLIPMNFNDFTSSSNIYYSEDNYITEELNKVKKLGNKLNIKISLPLPWDQYKNKGKCLSPWTRIQIMPSKKIKEEEWYGNAILSQCLAVTNGDLYSLGNLLKYDNFMEFWNNPYLVDIREKIINGNYPDNWCKNCLKYNVPGMLQS